MRYCSDQLAKLFRELFLDLKKGRGREGGRESKEENETKRWREEEKEMEGGKNE